MEKAPAQNPTPLAKPNIDVPPGIQVERQPVGNINAPNTAGGEVPPKLYRSVFE
jgi:hypothetical protein